MKTLISEVFLTILAVTLAVAAVVLVKDSLTRRVQEVGEYLEDRKSVREVVAETKRLSPEKLRSLAIEVLLWDTKRYAEWLEKKSMLQESQKAEQISRCTRTLAEEHTRVAALVQDMPDREIVAMIETETRNRNPAWRHDLLARLRG